MTPADHAPPKDLHRRLVQGAKKEGGSLNAEIVRRLEMSFDLEEATRKLVEQDLLKLAQEHVRAAKELQDGLITTGLLAGGRLSKGSRK